MRQIIQMAVVRCDIITPKTSSHSSLLTADAEPITGTQIQWESKLVPCSCCFISLSVWKQQGRKEKRGSSEVLEDGNQLLLLLSIIQRQREVQPHINPWAWPLHRFVHSPSIFVYWTAPPELLHRRWCWPSPARREAGGSEPGVVQVGHQPQVFSLGFAEFWFGVHLLPLKRATAAHDLSERRPHSEYYTKALILMSKYLWSHHVVHIHQHLAPVEVNVEDHDFHPGVISVLTVVHIVAKHLKYSRRKNPRYQDLCDKRPVLTTLTFLPSANFAFNFSYSVFPKVPLSVTGNSCSDCAGPCGFQ